MCWLSSGERAGGTGSITYRYDLVGNRLEQNRTGSAGTGRTSYTYDAVDQLIQEKTGDQTKTYKYDLEGNQIDAGADRFSYHLDHTLLSATVGGKSTNYTYDGAGLRLTSATSGGSSVAMTRPL